MSFARAVALAFTVSLSALTLSACGSVPKSSLQNEAALYPAKPQHYPIHGVDISHHQGPVDWAQAHAAGTQFAFLKATEGGDYLDDTFMAHWIATRDAGIKRGAYHFYYWCRPVEDQIAWYIRNVPVEPEALPPVLDVEWNGDSKTCPKKVPREEARAVMKRFLRAVEAHYHKRPIIYTSIDFYRDVIDGDLAAYPLWVRTVKAHPVVRYANRPWTFWQYTEFGDVQGIKGGVDRNVFVGTEDEWRQFADQGVIVASNTSTLPVNQQLAMAMPPAEGPANLAPVAGGSRPISPVVVAGAQSLSAEGAGTADAASPVTQAALETPAVDKPAADAPTLLAPMASSGAVPSASHAPLSTPVIQQATHAPAANAASVVPHAAFSAKVVRGAPPFQPTAKATHLKLAKAASKPAGKTVLKSTGKSIPAVPLPPIRRHIIAQN